MKRIIASTILAGAVATFGLAAIIAKPPAAIGAGGTDILHFFVHTAMTNEGTESNATGVVDVKQNKQGNANNQRLDIAVTGLTTNATYQLLALLGDDTNLTFVVDFTTDSNGAGAAHFTQANNGHGKTNKLGKGKSPLPAILDPLSNIRELTLFNAATQAVLTADLTAPDKLQYLIKRNLSTNGIIAQLRIKATTSQTQFRLKASGLNPTNDYFLVLNGGISQTNTTDSAGRLSITSLLANPGDILDLHSVALWDSVSNVVLSTELP
jgi:hypothetical protein